MSSSLTPVGVARPTPRCSSNPLLRPPLLALLLATSPAFAQSPAAAAGTPPAPGDIVELSPFEVTSEKDVGYLASNTLAGSRLNTSLKDTPAAISVLTPEFLSDIGAFNLTEALAYAANVELFHDDDRPATNGNAIISGYDSYRVRGMSATTARNYFVWSIPTETALVERIEDSRGPNSVLFGVASPGGLINENTKQARLGRAFRKASFTLADHESWRAHLDVNQPLGPRLAARFNWVTNKHHGFRHWSFEEHNRGHLALSYRLTDRTRLRAEYEHGQLDSNEPKRHNLLDRVLLWNSRGRPTFAAVPAAATLAANGLVQNPTAANQPRVTFFSNSGEVYSMRGTLATTGTSNVIKDMNLTDYSINVGGPGQDRSSRFNALTTFLEHQFSKRTFLELAYNHQDHRFDRYDARGDDVNGLKGDPQQLLPTGAANPNAGRLMLESAWTKLYRRDVVDTGRATLSHEVDAKKWGNYRFAALAEYEKSFIGSVAYNEIWADATTGLAAFNVNAPENAQNNVWRRTYVAEHDWATYYVQGPNRRNSLQNVRDPVTGRTLSARWIPTNPAETYSSRRGLMLATQARYFDNRLVVAAGIRRDDIHEFQQGRRRDPRTFEWVDARHPAEADPSQPSEWNSNVGRTKTAGLVYHLTPRFSVFYNRADNVSLPSRGATTLPMSGEAGDPIPVPPPKGEGEDFGLQVELLEGRVYARATYYNTRGRNQSTTFSNPTRQANTRILDALQSAGIISQAEHNVRNNVGTQGLFDHETKGIEFQLTANLRKNWRAQVNLAETDANETNKFLEWLAWEQQNIAYIAGLNTQFPTRNVHDIRTTARSIREELAFIRTGDNALGEQTEASGQGKLGNRRYKASAFTRYTFTDGWLRGAYVGGGYRHQSRMFVGLGQAGQKLHGNSYWVADLLAGYTVRGLAKNRALSFQLNVGNVFNQRKPLLTRYAADDSSVLREVVTAPTTWRFTTTLEF